MKRSTKVAFFGCAMIILSMGWYIVRLRNSNKKIVPLSDQFNLVKTSIYQDLPITSDDIVFVGTSLTEGFPVREFYNDTRFKNRGIQGNESSHIVERIKFILEARPAKVFVEMGVNDILDGVPESKLLSNFQKVIDIAKVNQTPLYFLSLQPYGMKYAVNNPKVVQVNSRLFDLCSKANYQYIDIYSVLSKNGTLDPAVTSDGIHLTGIGYQRWKEKIDSFVN
jgi:lysophospholipase L1-like esterase